jgi:hypothetical protein
LFGTFVGQEDDAGGIFWRSQPPKAQTIKGESKMSKGKIVPESTVFFGLLVLAVTLLSITPAMAGEQAVRTTANVYWNWDTVNPVGTSEIIRSSSGITAVFKTSGLPAGHAYTLWMVFFNNPELCSVPLACVAPPDVGSPTIVSDFHFVNGIVGGSGNLTLAGHLKVGDTSGSGLVEIGQTGFPLVDPFKAQVLLAIHSHGPKLTGQGLKSQISSFLGGCEVFLGPDGAGAGPQDVPDQIGECSTLQFSSHPTPAQ